MILPVDTLDDDRIEAYRHVADHEWLRARNLFVAEGRLLLQRLVAAPAHRIHSALVSPTALAAMQATLDRLECPVYVAAQPLLNAIGGFNFHRGCLALAERPAPRRVEELTASRLLLGLEGVGNPDNVGGLFRTAAAFGVDGVLLDGASGDPFYRKALRTSMGGVLRVPFVSADEWHAACGRVRDAGFEVVALITTPGATALEDYASRLSADARVLVLVGAEGSGLSDRSQREADVGVTIPMTTGVDSLNVTVAAGIALARIARRG